MSDQPDPTNDPTHIRPMRHTVRDAATYLGISQNAVRQRLKRGSLRSEIVNGVVYVLVGERPMSDPSATYRPNPRPTQPDPLTTQSDIPESTSDLVAALQADVVFLRAELEARREAERELRVLLAQMTESVKALPATVAETAPDAPGARLRDDMAQPGQSSVDGPETSQRPTRRAWWKVWKR